MILQPLNDNIIIKVLFEAPTNEQKTDSGLILPGKKEQELRKDLAEVISIGRGRVLHTGEILPPSVKEGNVILFNRYAGTQVTLEGQNYLIIKESDIMAIVK